MRIVVVGGGIAGLSAALRLRDRAREATGREATVRAATVRAADGRDDTEIVVVEQSNRLGGKLRTSPFAGAAVETGAEMFLLRERGGDSAALTLARLVGLGDDLVHPAPVPAAIALAGALHEIPGGTLLGVPADPSTLDGLARPNGRDHDEGRPLLGPGEDVAVGDLVRARLGDEVVDRLVDPMLGGVYAGRADELSLAATMPALHAAAQRRATLCSAVRLALAASPRPPGSPVFATVRGGLTRLVDRVGERSGADVRLRCPVRGLGRTTGGWRLVVGSTRDPAELVADAVVLAVPAAPASRLLHAVAPGAAADVGVLAYASVALVTLALPPGTALPELSGFLVPAGVGYAVKAATFLTTKWPHLGGAQKPVLVRASVGRHGEERVLRRSDDDLVAQVCHELATLVATSLPEPVAARVNRWGGGLPQYGVGHVDRVARARAALPATLALAGAAYDGVGIAACVGSGEAAADTVWTAMENDRHG